MISDTMAGTRDTNTSKRKTSNFHVGLVMFAQEATKYITYINTCHDISIWTDNSTTLGMGPLLSHLWRCRETHGHRYHAYPSPWQVFMQDSGKEIHQRNGSKGWISSNLGYPSDHASNHILDLWPI